MNNLQQKLRRVSIIGLFILGVVLVAGGVLLTRIPGETLYGFKVNVAEESLEYLRVTPGLKVRYHLALLERRLDEIQKLAAEEGVSEGDLWYFIDETEERSQELTILLAAEERGAFTSEEILHINHSQVALLQAIERMLEEHEALQVVEERFEDIRREVENIFGDRSEVFIATADEAAIRSFIEAMLERVQESTEGRTLDRRLQNSIEGHLERAAQDLANSDAENAIEEIAEALWRIEVALHLNRAEKAQ